MDGSFQKPVQQGVLNMLYVIYFAFVLGIRRLCSSIRIEDYCLEHDMSSLILFMLHLRCMMYVQGR